ncbi:ABC transporter ATP-binding protein [Bacillus sp. 2205SS5-2]|uniref:ABC transporter ATP-binding protein n=1 Tax=Bacillus sp. 2205SS5-2 TaxID=3109031 RepID=UPI00300677E3
MKIKDLRLKFPDKEELLFKDLSLNIKKNEKVLLLGPSGCGKSTLLQVLSGVIPTSVDVPMKAAEIEHPPSWGYVFQDPDTQFCMPFVDEEIAFVLENIQVPQKEMGARIKAVLADVGLSFEDVHTNIATLSGGMKQRLAIASVLALKPDTLFLDEPTALLDDEGTKAVWETVKQISHDKTVVIVEHKLNHVLELVNRIVLFNEKGEILADGAKEMILRQYRDTLRRQGVWYPEIWRDYLNQSPPGKISSSNEVVIELKDFKGYLQKKAKISVPEATIRRGEWITVVGNNGAGKSTLLHSLMHLIKTNGEYFLFGDLVSAKKVPEGVTFVFQNPEFQFVTNSVWDEIAYGLRLKMAEEREVGEVVEDLLQRFKLREQRNQHPYQLSMGQKRRLSVAASIVNKKSIILLDEPTFGQDAQNTFALLEMLQDYQREGVTIIMVTHDQHIVDFFATRVWTIEDGLLVSDNYNDLNQLQSPKRVML